MSRMAAALLLALAPPGGGGRGVTAEQALERYREVFKTTRELDCPRGSEDIVVCGRRGDEADPARLPLPQDLEPGARIPGSGASGRDALAANRCISRCQGAATIPILAIPGFIKRFIERVRDD